MDQHPIVITGASGFIGSWICEKIVDRYPACQVVGVARTLGHAARITRRNFAFIGGDLLSPDTYTKLPGRIEAVLHLAGDRRPNVPPSEFSHQCRANILATSLVADYAVGAKAKRLLYASSVYVYSGVRRMPFVEDDVPLPSVHLGATKLAGEALLASRARAGQFELLAFRIFTAYGPWSHPSQFIPEVIRKLSEAGPSARFAYPETGRDLVFVEDVAEAFVAGIEAQDVAGGAQVFNVGSGVSTSARRLVEMIARLLNAQKPIEFLQPPVIPADEQVSHQADVSKITRELGWQAQTALEDGLRRTVEAVRMKPVVSWR